MGYIKLSVYDYLTVVKMWVLLVVKLLRISGGETLPGRIVPIFMKTGLLQRDMLRESDQVVAIYEKVK